MGRKSSNKKRARETYFPDEENEKRQVYIVVGLMFIGIALAIWGVRINDEMLMPDKAIWLAILVSSLIATTILFLAWKNSSDRRGTRRVWTIAYSLFFGTMIGGPIAFFAINATNYYVKGDGIMDYVILDIIDTGKSFRRHSRECGHTYVEVEFKDIQYTVPFSCEYEYSLDKYKKVELTLTKGGLGYYMIVEKTLIRNEE